MRELIEGGSRKMGPRDKTQRVFNYTSEEKTGLKIETQRTSQKTFRRPFQDSGLPVEPSWEDAGLPRRKVERCEDLQKQRRAVESDVRKDGGSCLQRLLLRKRNARRKRTKEERKREKREREGGPPVCRFTTSPCVGSKTPPWF